MKRLLALAFVALFSACSCSTKGEYFPAIPLPGIPLEVDPSVQIATLDGGVGHGCPVNDILVTNLHIVLTKKGQLIQAVSISQGGLNGIAFVANTSVAYDLVLLEPMMPLRHLPGGDIAEPGDVVYWFEYDFRTGENILRARRRVARILRIVAGHYILDSAPVAGASGTCLINNEGEAIGVVNAGFEADNGEGAGVAILIPKDLSR